MRAKRVFSVSVDVDVDVDVAVAVGDVVDVDVGDVVWVVVSESAVGAAAGASPVHVSLSVVSVLEALVGSGSFGTLVGARSLVGAGALVAPLGS